MGVLATEMLPVQTCFQYYFADLWAELPPTVTECRGLHDAWIRGIIVRTGLRTYLPSTNRP